MSLHYTHTERDSSRWPEFMYRAYCSCGWWGQWRASQGTAHNDCARHMARETKGPQA